jgi:hypothetical protein
MIISDLFILCQGNSFELLNMQEDENSNISFVSRTSQNNGVVAKVTVTSVKPFEAGLITVALGGSVLSAFVQDNQFYTAFHIMVLKPKIEMTIEQKMFYCMIIKNNAYRYGYGRQANKTLKDIEIPSLDECNAIIGDYKIKPIKTFINGKYSPLLNIQKWKEFKLSDVFTSIENCKCSSAEELLEDGSDLFYIGAKKTDNGVMRLVKRRNEFVSRGNGIIFICDGQGSIGYSIYADNDFIGSTTLSIGYNKKLNKYNAMFFVTVSDLERFKYSFGRKRKSTLDDSTVKLPATSECCPDWQFMEDYIKSLPYSDII